jgi:hypothetical protein
VSRTIGLYVCPAGVFGLECRLGASGLRVDRSFQFPGTLATASEVAQRLAQCLESIRARRALVSVVVRGFGAAQHIIALPPAPDHVLAPIIDREMRRHEPGLSAAVFAWTPLPEEPRADEPARERALSVAAAPTALLDAIARAVQASGNVLEHVTVLAAAMERLQQEFLPENETAAVAAPLPDGLFIGFSVGGAMRLVVEPPAIAGTDDASALGEELELGSMFLRQQFHGAEVSRVGLLASPDALADSERVVGARLGVPVQRVAIGDLDASGCAALGAVLDARSDAPLSLAGRTRARQASAATRSLHTAATAAIVVAIAIGTWTMVQAIRARDTGIALRNAEARIEQESFGLTSARETATQRKLIRDARAAMHQVDDDRLWLQRALTRIASASGMPIQLDSLTLDRSSNGWAARVAGRASGVTNARAVQVLSEFYTNIPRQLDVADLTLESLAYADSSEGGGGEPVVRFTVSFGVNVPTGAAP